MRGDTDFWCEETLSTPSYVHRAAESAVARPRRVRRKTEHLHKYRVPAGRRVSWGLFGLHMPDTQTNLVCCRQGRGETPTGSRV